MKTDLLLSGLASALLLVGCASAPSPARTTPAPPDLSNVGGPAPAPRPAGDIRKERGREGGGQPSAVGWRKPGVTRAQKAADIENCYQGARAQVDSDIRIDDDIAAAREHMHTYQSRLGDLTRRVDSHYYSKQRIARFEGCMKSKGYDR